MKKILYYYGLINPSSDFYKFLLKMRLSIILLFCGAFSLMASSSYSQNTKISLDMNDATVESVLNKIEEISEFYFLYNHELIDVKQKVNISVQNEPIKNVLNEIFTDEVSFVFSDRQIVLKPVQKSEILKNIAAQQLSVSGTVRDASSGDAMPGVNILIKGTLNGTLSDGSGKYNLPISDLSNGVLVFSFIGFKTIEVPIEGKATVNVRLEADITGLDEVVVIGYGTQKKSQVTGAISSVKSEDIVNRAFSDAAQSLQGKTPGVQIFLPSGAPGTSSSIRVRGMGSNSNNNPLYVVDGRQVNNIDYLDANDIQSMEILKDASAAAIYGARAGNGVVLVTTKSGSNNTKGRIEYKYMETWQSNNNVPDMLKAQQYFDYQTTLSSSNSANLNTDWGANKTTDTDWLDYIFGTGRLTRHNVSLSGGSSDATYYTALSFNSNDGPVIGNKDKYQRVTGTFNGDYQVKSWLKLTSNNQISLSKFNGGANVFMAAMQFTPLITPTVEVPTPFMESFVNNGYNLIRDENGNYGTIPSFSMGDQINPIIQLNRNREWSKNTSINGSTQAILTPFEGFTWTTRFGYSFGSGRDYNQSLPGVYGNQSYSYNQSVSASDDSFEDYQLENFANYTRSFGRSNLTAMVGMSFIESQYSSVGGQVSGTGKDYGFQNTDELYAFWAYKSGGYSQTVSGGEENVGRKLAYYSRFNYDFSNKYYIQASFRADAADLALLPKNGRWGYFPAASVGWTVSNEDFMSNFSKVSHLKIRASWGQNGSTAGLNNYAWQSIITSSSRIIYPFIPGQMVYTSGRYPSTAGNDALKWETSEQLDLGFDLRLLNDRLSFSYDWYNKTTKDLIMTGITPSYIMGVTASPFNAGRVSNKGHEFDLGWRDVIGEMKYSINTNFTTLKNKVEEITSTLTSIAGAGQDSHTVTWFEQGYPMWHFKTYNFTGIDAEGNPTFQDVNGNETLDADDKVDVGSGIPTYSFGITLNASYKNFDVTLFGSGQGGNKVMQVVTRAFSLQANVPSYLLEDAWTPENTNTDVPKVGMDHIGYYYVSDAQIFNGDYFKLKQAQIGYTLPKGLTSRILIDNLRLYASVENAFTITKYPGFDPEIMSSGDSMGIDAGRYPNNRNFILGVNVTF